MSKSKVNPHLKKELFKTLHQAICDLKSSGEVAEFLQAFLSPSEHETLAKRLAVAYWLNKGRGYENIRKNLKVSSATIASIQSSMKNNGVSLALRNIKAEEWANVWAEKIRKLTKLNS